MALDPKVFDKVCDPTKTLDVANPDDRKYYIDFSPVRGTQLIKAMFRKINKLADEPTCQLFTGHIGCGKSTELLRLKAQLEKENFHVAYFEINMVLDVQNVDITDILIAIARQVAESLKVMGFEIKQEKHFKAILDRLFSVLKEVGIAVPYVPNGLLSVNLFNLLAKAKDSPDFRSRLRINLEPQTSGILEAINQEILEPAKSFLREKGKKGLVVIVDNLDRIANTLKSPGKTQSEYLFEDRGDQLKKLNCHIVYTIPFGMIFSNINWMGGKFDPPHVLPMIQFRNRENFENETGMNLLRQMVLARAFPDESENQRLNRIAEIFDNPETLSRLCRVSGGHVRGLLRLLYESVDLAEEKLPISGTILEQVIREWRNRMTLGLSDEEWNLLKQVRENRKPVKNEQFQTLLRGLFILEYRDDDGSWFDVNPILAETKELSLKR